MFFPSQRRYVLMAISHESCCQTHRGIKVLSQRVRCECSRSDSMVRSSSVDFNSMQRTQHADIFRVDSIGSYALDINPILGNIHCGDDSAQFPAEPAVLCLSTLNLPASLLSALQLLKRVNSELLMRKTLWLSPTDIDQLIHPIVQRFLSLRYNTHFFSPVCCCVRSGALLYLAEFRRRSGIIPLITEIHLQQLVSSMEALDLTSVAPELTLWLLTVGAMESTSESDQNYFYSRLNLALQTIGIDSALLWTQYLNQVIWLDHLFDQKLDIIWRTLTG